MPPYRHALTAIRSGRAGAATVLTGAASLAQANAVEHSLVAALPLGPQSAAGGVSLPKTFHGELLVRALACLLALLA